MLEENEICKGGNSSYKFGLILRLYMLNVIFELKIKVCWSMTLPIVLSLKKVWAFQSSYTTCRSCSMYVAAVIANPGNGALRRAGQPCAPAQVWCDPINGHRPWFGEFSRLRSYGPFLIIMPG